jgi:nucleoside-diphosphate-sugar epimerase
MKILITGANGYIGSTLAKNLQGDITTLTKQEVDLTKVEQVDEFFKNKKFDVVIHCATAGGSRLKEDTAETTHQNLQMFYNLLRNKKHYNKFINIGSGAEFDRNTKICPLWNDNKYPTDPYGMSKHIINQLIQNIENFYTIRVYAVFDENELDTRFIKANIKKYINKESIIIHKDKMMDFFYMEDFISVVNYYINNKTLPKEIDCSYKEKYHLNNIADIINNLDFHKVNIENSQEFDKPYFGDSTPLDILKIKLIGLEQGIIKTYNKI